MVSATEVLFYVPNWIGYARFICMTLAFYYAPTNYEMFMMFYLAAFVGDVVDGFAARTFNQCKLPAINILRSSEQSSPLLVQALVLVVFWIWLLIAFLLAVLSSSWHSTILSTPSHSPC